MSRGLRKVKILHWRTPDSVFSKVVSLLNQFHQGAWQNHWDVLQEALKLESAWKADCTVTRLNTYNPRYQAAYESFVLSKSASSEYNGCFKLKLSYYNAISLAHNFQVLDFFDEFQSWSNSNVDYLDGKYNAHTCIAQMHALTTMILGGAAEVCGQTVVQGGHPGSAQVLCLVLRMCHFDTPLQCCCVAILSCHVVYHVRQSAMSHVSCVMCYCVTCLPQP